MGQESQEPVPVFENGGGHVLDACFKILTIRVHRTEHYLVAEDELEIDFIGRNLNFPVAAGHARKNKDTVFRQALHRVKDDGRVSGRLEYQIERITLFGIIRDRNLSGRSISSTEILNESRIEIRLRGLAERHDLDTAKPEHEG